MAVLAVDPLARLDTGSEPVVRPVRVLHVLPSLLGGGMERATLRLIRGSTGGAGVSPAWPTGADEPAAVHGLCILREVNRGLLAECRARAQVWVLGEGASRPRRLSSWWRLRQVIRRFHPDVVHARSTGVWPDAALATRALRGVRLLLSFHGKTQLARPSLKRRLLNRWAGRCADAVLTVSGESAEYVRQEWGVSPDKLAVIRNGVDLERFRPAVDEAEVYRLRGELGLDANGRLVVCVANLVPIKGLDVLLRAWAPVAARHAEARLLLAGDGPLRARLQGLAWNLGCRQSILFAGARENVAELLRAADLFVLPSRYEACSNAILEAMASGLAVVACDTGGNRELVVPGVTGWLVRPNSPGLMAARIMETLGNDATRRQAGRAGREHAARVFDQSDWLTACNALYASLAWGHASSAGWPTSSEVGECERESSHQPILVPADCAEEASSCAE